MRLAIMQPYVLPYIGYWQLMGAVDRFVVYDNIKYTKKGWINRNRLLLNGQDATFSLPLAQGSDSLNVDQRELASSFDRRKLVNQFVGAYRKAPQFDAALPLLERVLLNPATNLFDYLWHGIHAVRNHLGLQTELVRSSAIAIDHEGLKAQDKVLALCEALGASTYINAIGGLELYRREAFAARGIELRFHKAHPIEYGQFGSPFVPWLSIVDVLMFNPATTVQSMLHEYSLT
jgi:hypothetical protein